VLGCKASASHYVIFAAVFESRASLRLWRLVIVNLYQAAEWLTLGRFGVPESGIARFKDGKRRRFAMGQAIALRSDYTADQLRRLARQTKDVAQARRLLAIAAILDGASRAEAARIGGMDRQTLRDWVIRFNEHGPDGLTNIASPGVPPKLGVGHRAFLGRLVEEGPIPAIHGVVRWRACDLIALLHEEFGISVSDDTIYRTLKDMGFAHMSARPKAYRQDAQAIEAFKKSSQLTWPKSVSGSRLVHP
jgi:transposase